MRCYGTILGLLPPKAPGRRLAEDLHAGGADQASPRREGGNWTSPSDLRGKSLLAPNLAEGLAEHVSKAYEAGTSVISLEESHTSDLMQGEAILPEGTELDPDCCFLSASQNPSPWLKTRL